MTTYNFDGLIVYEEGNLVDPDGAGGQPPEMQMTFGDVEQSTFGFISSVDTNSFSYTVNGTEIEPNGSSLDVTINGFGDAYALDIPAISEYATLMDSDYDYASVVTISWNDGTAKSATVLAAGWEYEDFENMEYQSVTMVITLDGDALPTFADYDAFDTFLGTTTFSATAPAGYQAGDTILLSTVEDYVNKEQADLIRGGYTDDEITGWLGDDTINGNDGNDTINGGKGFDVLRGNGGNDEIYGGNLGDVISGGDGDDMLYGQRGNDTVYGGAGQDTVYLGGGRDVFNGSVGVPAPEGNTDAPYEVAQSDTVFGGAGNDIIRGGAGDDYFYGQNGNDKIRGGDGSDIIKGGDGNDRLFGGNGADDIYAGSGNDTLTGGSGDDGFVFKDIGATDANVIRDFELGVDFIEIEDTGSASMVVQNGDILITQSNGATILVEGVTDVSALQNDIEYLIDV